MGKRSKMIMKYAKSGIGRAVLARFLEGEDLLETITQVATKAKVHAGFFFLIGALKSAKLGFYQNGKYIPIEIQKPLEIVSCLGNISVKEGKAFPHAHLTVSDNKGKVFGGHAMPGCIVRATAELILVEALGLKVTRQLDEITKLSLLSFSKSIAGSKEVGSTSS
jgi:predicted DNA-binding protein with PD1-like motif